MTTQKARGVDRIVTAHKQEEGGGFIVRRPFPSQGLSFVDPFLLLDEMGPVDYAPGKAIGAPDHPHRGFETVTYILEGGFEHEDSAGNRGAIEAGDVQWMTAGAGVVHSEMPASRIRKDGGRVHGFQIWVNLPASEKMIPPRYQGISSAQIPTATSPDGLAKVRVIAGEALGVKAVIETRTPILYHDWTLAPGAKLEVPLPPDYAVMAYVFGGKAEIGGTLIEDGQLAILGEGDSVTLGTTADATEDARILFLGGVPLREPVARYGPFVMNTEQQIRQAVRDFQEGRMAQIMR